MVNDYRDLEVWKKGVDISVSIDNITNKFSAAQRFGRGYHMQKTADSISMNIAEGSIRQYTKEYIQFCYISLGSCAELETQVEIARRCNVMKQDDTGVLAEMLDHERRMLRNLIKSLKRNRGN
jgi:four helix bundle protein